MTRAEITVDMYKGDKFPLLFVISEGSDVDGWSALVLHASGGGNSTITITVWRKDDPTTKIVDDQSVTIDDATEGTCHYVLSATETATAGQYVGQLKITNLGTYDAIKRTDKFLLNIADTEA